MRLLRVSTAMPRAAMPRREDFGLYVLAVFAVLAVMAILILGGAPR